MAISYPLEISENPDFYRSMIEFKMFQTQPAKITQVASAETFSSSSSGSSFTDSLFNVGGDLLSAIGDVLTSEPAKLVSQGRASDALKKATPGAVVDRETIVEAEGFEAIRLYMPVGFNQTDTFTYTTAELGAGGAAALGVAQAGGGAGEAASAAISQATAGITDTIGALTGNGGLGQLALARLGQKIGGAGQAAAELAAQAVMNPNIRATFKAVAPKRYQFLFNFIPKNAAEADAVDRIIYDFRRAAYPKDVPSGAIVPLLFEYPLLFRIVPKVRTANGFEVAVGTPIRYCYCESISVNTNPIGNNTFHADGHAIQTDLSINFLEYRTIARDDVKKGYGKIDGDAEPPGIKVELETNSASRISDLQRQANAIGVGDL